MKEKRTYTSHGTVDEEEIERFSKIASEWWNTSGKFKPLHQINPLRIQYILDQVSGNRKQKTEKNAGLDLPSATCHLPPLKGLSLLDIGCGGGLIAEPMCRLGANVTAIDASEKNIKVAKAHAQEGGLKIEYLCTTSEDLLKDSGFRIQDSESKKSSPESRISNPGPYDIVLALEIIEHVADVSAFVHAACGLLKPGGLIIWSTINRTGKAFALAIVGAEYVLRWLPRGTHTWEKFVKPSELCAHLRHNSMEVIDMTGMTLHPLSFKWQMDRRDLSVNYLLAGRKNDER